MRPALRGTRGYEVQQEAWDAVLPGWRGGMDLVLRMGDRPPLTPEDHEELHRLSAALRADNRRLARCWSALLFQALYRRCPALGGWFPE